VCSKNFRTWFFPALKNALMSIYLGISLESNY
jgi:hypothetical protein